MLPYFMRRDHTFDGVAIETFIDLAALDEITDV
jgi:hypothetical protein